MKFVILILSVSVATICGCTMFTAWKTIPPPGGCDQCHTVPIGTNWQAGYKAAQIADERGRLPFQTPEYNNPASNRPQIDDSTRVEGVACFDCHTSPTPGHKGHKGRYYH